MWVEKENVLHQSFEFEDFISAFAFMTEVAMIAEKMNHHPNWSNVWNRVDIDLSTHDAGNIVTQKDHKLASEISRIYNRFHS